MRSCGNCPQKARTLAPTPRLAGGITYYQVVLAGPFRYSLPPVRIRRNRVTIVEKRVETRDIAGRSGGVSPLLKVEDLHVHFLTSRGVVRAVEGLSFHVDPGEIVAIVGESGSGKSVSALSIMRLLPRHTGRIPRGRITFDGRNLLDLDETEMRKIR